MVIRQGFLSRWLVVAIIAALVLAPSAAAQPARGGVATVKVTNGTVAVGNPDVGGQPAEIEAGETSKEVRLGVGDVVINRTARQCDIRFDDGSSVRLDPGAEIRITAVQPKDDQHPSGSITVKIEKGVVNFTTKPGTSLAVDIGPGPAVKVKADDKGRKFSVGRKPDGSVTAVATENDQVQVTAGGETKEVKNHQQAVIPRDGKTEVRDLDSGTNSKKAVRDATVPKNKKAETPPDDTSGPETPSDTIVSAGSQATVRRSDGTVELARPGLGLGAGDQLATGRNGSLTFEGPGFDIKLGSESTLILGPPKGGDERLEAAEAALLKAALDYEARLIVDPESGRVLGVMERVEQIVVPPDLVLTQTRGLSVVETEDGTVLYVPSDFGTGQPWSLIVAPWSSAAVHVDKGTGNVSVGCDAKDSVVLFPNGGTRVPCESRIVATLTPRGDLVSTSMGSTETVISAVFNGASEGHKEGTQILGGNTGSKTIEQGTSGRLKKRNDKDIPQTFVSKVPPSFRSFTLGGVECTDNTNDPNFDNEAVCGPFKTPADISAFFSKFQAQLFAEVPTIQECRGAQDRQTGELFLVCTKQ